MLKHMLSDYHWYRLIHLQMGHPMHLHGHKFWILGSGEGEFPYSSVQDVPSSLVNLDDPPYRDTVELPASGWAVIRLAFPCDHEESLTPLTLGVLDTCLTIRVRGFSTVIYSGIFW